MACAEERIFADLPDLETERLFLRKMHPDDSEAVFAYASDPEVTRYVLCLAHRSFSSWGRPHVTTGPISSLKSPYPTNPTTVVEVGCASNLE